MFDSQDACSHIKTTKFSRISESLTAKPLNGTGEDWKCSTCKKDFSFVYCLQVNCGHTGCGSIFSGDGYKHYSLTKHPVALHVKEKKIMCFVCNISCSGDQYDSNFNSQMQEFVSLCNIIEKEVDLEAIKRYETILKSEPNFDFTDEIWSESEAELPGLVGLRNMGNSCYMNSAIQCLSNLEQIHSVFGIDDCKYLEESSRYALSHHFSTLIQRIWSGKHKVILPKDFVEKIGEKFPMFTSYTQQDSHEFLRCILDSLHEENKNTAGEVDSHSVISDIFGGTIISSVECLKCHKISVSEDKFFDLSVNIPSSEIQLMIHESLGTNDPNEWLMETSVSDCMECFCMPEEMSGDDQIVCYFCGQASDCKKSLRISHSPEVLCIHIKRFKYENKGIKLTNKVKFSSSLNISRYLSDASLPSDYSLIAIVSHSGSILGGHYIAYCKNSINGKWYKFNDSIVSEVSEFDVFASEAYLLFYSKN